MSHRDLAVSVRGLSKSYSIAHNAPKHTTLAEAFSHAFRKPRAQGRRETFWALRDIEFDIQKGDVVGVIGRNGAGKSTLLKVLSRITEPTSGQIDLYGRVGSLLEVGTGFHPELSGRENVFMNGAILGMSRREIARQFDAIVEFSGTEKFLDTPVKRYSSGMYIRLAFAVAAHLNPEILIIDEVLAVGDAEFQKKCLGKMKDVADSGRTVLFVSHNIVAIRNLCQKCLLLSGGQVESFGGTDEVAAKYASRNQMQTTDVASRTDRNGSGEVRCIGIQLLDFAQNPISSVEPDMPFLVELTLDCRQPLHDLEMSVDVDSLDGGRVTTLYSGFLNQKFVVSSGVVKAICRVAGLNLRPASYSLSVMLGNDRGHQYDFVSDAVPLEVEKTDIFHSGRLPEHYHGPVFYQFDWQVMNDNVPSALLASR